MAPLILQKAGFGRSGPICNDWMAHVDSNVYGPGRFSYWFMAGALVLIDWLHLGGAFVAALFAYLALNRLNFRRRGGKWLSVSLCLVLLAALVYGFGYVVREMVQNLPDIADRSIPLLLEWAKDHRIELPFSDYDGLREAALDWVKGQAHYLGSAFRVARGAGREFVLLIAACVIAIGLFLNPRMETDRGQPSADNLFSIGCDAISERFTAFYRSFAIIMGAQVTISAINTVLTGAFVLLTRLPYAELVIGATFLCGLVPVVGNLVSNTLVVCIAFTVSPQKAIEALIFLVVIHKLEYFLNSKIVGHRIRNPFWLTLLALVVGEKLMGVPGMILAPVVLNYIKLEASKIQAPPPAAVVQRGV
jgi:predicted PurR-regulated permease PerM